MGLPSIWVGVGANLLFAGVAFCARSVTLSGALSGLLLGTWIYAFLGARGFSIVAAFFIVASLFTRWGYRRKKSHRMAQARGGRRTYREVFANGLVGACYAALVFFTGNFLYEIGFVASFATALADTTATELGSLYGRRAYLLPSFKRVASGTPGAVSLEGTLCGMAAALLLASFAQGVGMLEKREVIFVLLGATFGFLAESVMVGIPFFGDHDIRNLCNTALGAFLAVGLAVLFL